MAILSPEMVAALRRAYDEAIAWLLRDPLYPTPVPRAVEVARELRAAGWVASERDVREACALVDGLRLIDEGR